MITRKTIEDALQKNDARMVKLRQEIALIEGEQSAFRKLLGVDGSEPAQKRRRISWPKFILRIIPEMQARKVPMKVGDMLAAVGEPDDENARQSLNALLRKMSIAKDKFVQTGPREYGLIVFGHTNAPRAVKLLGEN